MSEDHSGSDEFSASKQDAMRTHLRFLLDVQRGQLRITVFVKDFSTVKNN